MNIIVRNGKVHPFISVVNGKQVSYNLENDIVRLYMKNVSYHDGYGKSDQPSLIRPYCRFVNESISSSWTEITRPVLLFGDGDTVKLTNDNKTLSYQLQNGCAKIYNLIPRCTYTWKMYKSGKEIDKGSFTTEGTVRMIKLGDSVNCRDIGGYPCEGGYVAYNKLIRGIQIDNADYVSVEAQTLRDMGITGEVDLRLKNGRYTPKNIGLTYYGSVYGASKVIKSDKYGILGYAPLLTNTRNLNNCLLAIITELEKGGGVFFHCTSGADRTGTFSAILLGLLGVSEENIIKDWEMTSFCCWYNFKRIDTEDLNDFPFGEMRTFFKKLDAYNGNTLQEKIIYWLTNKASVKQETIDKLKNLLIVKS